MTPWYIGVVRSYMRRDVLRGDYVIYAKKRVTRETKYVCAVHVPEEALMDAVSVAGWRSTLKFVRSIRAKVEDAVRENDTRWARLIVGGSSIEYMDWDVARKLIGIPDTMSVDEYVVREFGAGVDTKVEGVNV